MMGRCKLKIQSLERLHKLTLQRKFNLLNIQFRIPGYFGDFKCKTTSTAADSCKVQTMGMTDDGSFTYEF